MNKKKVAITGLSLLCIMSGIIAGTLTGKKASASANDDRSYISSMVSYYDFDELLNIADNVISGSITEMSMHENYDAYTVEITGSFKGELEGAVEIRNYLYEYFYEYQDAACTGTTCTDYEVGQEYLFILEHIDSVYDEEYVILSDTFIPLEQDAECFSLSQSIDVDNVISYVDTFEYKESSVSAKLANEYVDSTELEEIVSGTQYVLKIEVSDFMRETEVCDIYYCNVKEILQGDPTTTDNDQIIVPFFKNTVKQGESYIVLLNADTEDAVIYTLSSKNSVRKLSEIKTIEGFIEGE